MELSINLSKQIIQINGKYGDIQRSIFGTQTMHYPYPCPYAYFAQLTFTIA